MAKTPKGPEFAKTLLIAVALELAELEELEEKVSSLEESEKLDAIKEIFPATVEEWNQRLIDRVDSLSDRF